MPVGIYFTKFRFICTVFQLTQNAVTILFFYAKNFIYFWLLYITEVDIDYFPWNLLKVNLSRDPCSVEVNRSMKDMRNFSEQHITSGVHATLHIRKRHAGGDPHVARHAQQARQQCWYRAHASRLSVDPRLYRASRYASTNPQPQHFFQPTTSPATSALKTLYPLKAPKRSWERS